MGALHRRGPVGVAGDSHQCAGLLDGFGFGRTYDAFEAIGVTYMQLQKDLNPTPQLLHRVGVIGSGTLDSLPHNGTVVTLLAVCGSTQGESYLDIVMVSI